MIVNYGISGWEIITQRAHGLLAAQLGFHWKEKDRPRRWVETILAIAEHDDAECEFEGEDILNKAGGPLDFSMRAFDPRHCQLTCRQSLSKSRYIALLHTMHLIFLYSQRARTNMQAREFIAGLRKSQAKLKKELGLSSVEAERIYGLLEWCDALSLLLCQHAIQPEHRMIEISKGPDDVEYQLRQEDDHRLTVSPWPFNSDHFSVHVESRKVRSLTFSSAADFHTKFREAKVSESVYEFSKEKRKLKRKGR